MNHPKDPREARLKARRAAEIAALTAHLAQAKRILRAARILDSQCCAKSQSA